MNSFLQAQKEYLTLALIIRKRCSRSLIIASTNSQSREPILRTVTLGLSFIHSIINEVCGRAMVLFITSRRHTRAVAAILDSPCDICVGRSLEGNTEILNGQHITHRKSFEALYSNLGVAVEQPGHFVKQTSPSSFRNNEIFLSPFGSYQVVFETH